MVTGKIGIHGESLGGCVASYIAKRNKVDFVFSDRTFASVLDVAQYRFGGSFIKYLLKFLTGWSEECEANFHEINGPYKVLGCDPQDGMIIEMSSLKTGLAQKLVKESLFNQGIQNCELKHRGVFKVNNYLILDTDFAKLVSSLQALFDMNKDFNFRSQHR
jgi:hypothetical protein